MTEQEKHADKLKAVAEWFRDCKTLTLEKLPHGLIAALEAGAAALLRQSPPPALAVEEAKAALAQSVRALHDAVRRYAVVSEEDTCWVAVHKRTKELIAAVQSSRSGEPGTCATCQHRQGDLVCHQAESPIYRMATSDTQAAKLRCIFHTPQEPSR